MGLERSEGGGDCAESLNHCHLAGQGDRASSCFTKCLGNEAEDGGLGILSEVEKGVIE